MGVKAAPTVRLRAIVETKVAVGAIAEVTIRVRRLVATNVAVGVIAEATPLVRRSVAANVAVGVIAAAAILVRRSVATKVAAGVMGADRLLALAMVATKVAVGATEAETWKSPPPAGVMNCIGALRNGFRYLRMVVRTALCRGAGPYTVWSNRIESQISLSEVSGSQGKTDLPTEILLLPWIPQDEMFGYLPNPVVTVYLSLCVNQ
jgi:hypothetical protein